MKCAYYENVKCQSCSLLNNSYTDSLLLKEQELKQLFPDHTSVILPPIGIQGEAAGSRNKAKFAVFTHENQLTFGYYHSDGSYQELENCPLHASGINQLLPGIRDILNKYKIEPYDLPTKSGELKYLLISSSENNDSSEFLLRFVLRTKNSLPAMQQVATEIQSLSSSLTVISVNIQPIHQAILEGEEEIVLSDKKFITHYFDEFKLTLGTRSFFQVTAGIAKRLYNSLAKAIQQDSPSSLLDLYCGVGAFSFYASRHCNDIVGVEISAEAIACAKNSMIYNQKQIQFLAKDVEDYLAHHDKQFDAVLVNPPRRGLNVTILNKLKLIAPRFIYYSSCNANTLLRDYCEIQNEYDIKSLQIFDMFPYTRHYETLMCLHKK